MGVRKTDRRDLWVPMSMAELALRDRDGRPARVERAGDLFLDYVGRRRGGVTIEQVAAEAAVVARASRRHAAERHGLGSRSRASG